MAIVPTELRVGSDSLERRSQDLTLFLTSPEHATASDQKEVAYADGFNITLGWLRDLTHDLKGAAEMARSMEPQAAMTTNIGVAH